MVAGRAGTAWWIIGLLLLAVGCYSAPWYAHSTAGFTMNAFDLAEWASVHPAVRSSHPPMITSFLLRFPLVAVVVGLALVVHELPDPRYRWMVRAVAGLLLIRLFPPVDFFTSARQDPNYRQMAFLFALASVGWLSSLAAYRLPVWARAWLLAVLMAASVLAGWSGLSRAGVLLDNFEIAVRVGWGVVGYSLIVAVMIAVLVVWPAFRTTERDSMNPRLRANSLG